MSKTSLILPSGHPTSAASMHRRNFLIGAGAAGMALGTALGTAYTQIATAPDYSLRIAPLRLELAPGKVIETFGYNGTVPGPVLAAARRPASQHRYPQRHRYRRHRALARALRARGGRRRDGGRIADGGARRHAALHVHGQAQRHALVSQPRRCREGSDAQPVLRDVRLPDHRTDQRSRPLRPGSAARRAPLGGPLGQHAGHPQRSAARQRPRGAVQVGIVQRQDARSRRAYSRPRRRARAVSAAQRQPDPERHARASRPPLHRDRARRQSGADSARRSTRCFSRRRNVPT